MIKQEIIDILQDDTKSDWLFKEADRIRRENVGDEIHLRALIEFSNICKRQCLYCGLRSPNKEVERYRLSKDEILASAKSFTPKIIVAKLIGIYKINENSPSAVSGREKI